MDYRDIIVMILSFAMGILIYQLVKLRDIKHKYDEMEEFYVKTINNKNNRIRELYSELELLRRPVKVISQPSQVETLRIKKASIGVNPISSSEFIRSITDDFAVKLVEYNFIEFEVEHTMGEAYVTATLRVIKPKEDER